MRHNVATVAAPTTPLDTTPPTVRLLTPSAGATVSGTVTVQAEVPVVVTAASGGQMRVSSITLIAIAMTDSSGRARFRVSGPRGTYTLTVTAVARTGYVFDASGSVLSRSITR